MQLVVLLAIQLRVQLLEPLAVPRLERRGERCPHSGREVSGSHCAWTMRSGMIAPFGVPVLPEEWTISAIRSSPSSLAGSGSHGEKSPKEISSASVVSWALDLVWASSVRAAAYCSRSSSTRSS